MQIFHVHGCVLRCVLRATIHEPRASNCERHVTSRYRHRTSDEPPNTSLKRRATNEERRAMIETGHINSNTEARISKVEDRTSAQSRSCSMAAPHPAGSDARLPSCRQEDRGHDDPPLRGSHASQRSSWCGHRHHLLECVMPCIQANDRA